MVLDCIITSDQNLEKTRNTKKYLLPAIIKQTTSDESNLIGTRAEETHWYKNSPAKYDECEFCCLNYYTAKSIKSRVSGCVMARAERDGTRAETRFRLSPKRTSPFKSVGASV